VTSITSVLSNEVVLTLQVGNKPDHPDHSLPF